MAVAGTARNRAQHAASTAAITTCGGAAVADPGVVRIGKILQRSAKPGGVKTDVRWHGGSTYLQVTAGAPGFERWHALQPGAPESRARARGPAGIATSLN
jgi:hypothetical protein